MKMNPASEITEENPPSKIPKLNPPQPDEKSNAITNGAKVSTSVNHNSRSLQIVKVLKHDARHKTITLHAKFSPENDESDALVILEKASFPTESSQLLSGLLNPINSSGDGDQVSEVSNVDWSWCPVMHNDVYHKYVLMLTNGEASCADDSSMPSNHQLSEMKATLVHPATQSHLDKASPHLLHLVRETGETYRTVTRPHYQATQFSLSWVYNALEGKSETDRVVYRHVAPGEGFLLMQDYKWDGRSLEELYCLILVEDRSLHSIRDLRGDQHLPLLRAMWREARQAVADKYGIEKSRLRCYFHYQPTFYHLHVHITPTNCECVGGAVSGRAHLLQDVIARLEERSDYYETATLFYQLADNDPLWGKMKTVEGALD